ncbi:MAG: serine hydrolase domain-containing protein [Pseudomonadota bacterium]
MQSRRALPALTLASLLAAPAFTQAAYAADPAPASTTVTAAPAAAAIDGKTFTGKLATDQLLLSGGGTQVTAPIAWSVRRDGALLILDTPEPDTHVAIIDVQAADAAAAIKAAWARYRPADTHALKLISDGTARDGWEERKIANYETSPNERAVIQAIASRRGSNWSVLILDGSEQTVEKRGAAVSLVFKSARPEGYQRESFAGRSARPLDAARIAEMRSFLADAMKQLGVPGASFALMDHGKIVYEGGVGVRQLGKPELVDANTLFMAASNTKGMSTLLLSMLADEGKLRWDQPVTELYPAFRLGSADVTKSVLVKHLVCACTGLPRQDMEWLFEYRSATPESSLKLLATNSPTSGFGEVFQYNNLMASAAGYIGGHLAYPSLKLGDAYDKAMQVRIFDPLGMKSTTFNYTKALHADHASPHSWDVDTHTKNADMAPNYSIIPHRPAGGVWTSAHDLIRYVQLEANQGKLPDGKQLVSANNLLMRRQPQVSMGEDRSYGMGLMSETAWGIPVVYHGGSLIGYKSNIYLLPDTGIGAVLLTNADEGQSLLRPFMRRLLEVVYDGKPEAAEDVKVAAARMRKEAATERKRLALPADHAVIAKLARHYHSKELGDLDLRSNGRDATVDVGEWQSPIATRKNDDGTMSLITTTPGMSGFEFVVATESGKRALILRDGQHEYKFIESGKEVVAGR